MEELVPSQKSFLPENYEWNLVTLLCSMIDMSMYATSAYKKRRMSSKHVCPLGQHEEEILQAFAPRLRIVYQC